MISEVLIFMALTWAVMFATFFLHRFRRLHTGVMSSIIALDVLFPVYLLVTRDWQKRFFEDGEILSFLLWMHLMLIITLYVLYVVQVQAGRRLLRGDDGIRGEHRGQGMAILVTRGLVIMTGGLLVEPPAVPEDG